MPYLELISATLAVVGNAFLGFFTYAKNPKSTTNRLFFLFTCTIAAYIIANFFALHQSNDEATFFWIKNVIATAVVINQIFFLFAAVFPQKKLELNNILLYISIIFSLLLIPLVLMGVVFEGIVPHTTQPIPGFGIIFFLAHTVLLLGGGCFLLVRKYFRVVGIQKTQIRFLLLGVIAMFVSIGITNIMFVILFNTTAFVGLLPFYTLIFMGFTSYTILKHRFLDIQMVVARTVVYSVVVILLGIVFSASVYTLTSFLFGQKVDTRSTIVFIGVVFFVVFVRDPMIRIVERITEKIFFRKLYNSSEFLGRMSKIMSATIDLQEISSLLLVEINKTLKSSSSGVYLFRNGTIIWDHEEGGEFKGETEFRKSELPRMAKILTESFSKSDMFIFDEMEESEEKKILRNSGIYIMLPLVVKEVLIGAIVFGEKESGNIYTSQDIDILKIVVPEIAIAINNSLSYEEIRRFNITLKEEVARATTDLKQANEKLEQLDKLKDEFVSLASHELRTPMTVIKSYIWLLLEGKVGPLNEKQKTYIDRTYSSTNRLINMVNDMLNISRIESGRFTIDPKPMDITTLINEVISEMQPKAQEQGLQLLFATPQAPFPQVMADQDRIKQVLINLVGNSLKFTPQGGSISLIIEQKDGYVITHVKDTGRGIKATDMDKLFRKFNMLGSNYLTKQSGQGTGLGLYLSKALVELHHGRIGVSSEGEGKGSTFSFTLPIVQNAVTEQTSVAG